MHDSVIEKRNHIDKPVGFLNWPNLAIYLKNINYILHYLCTSTINLSLLYIISMQHENILTIHLERFPKYIIILKF